MTRPRGNTYRSYPVCMHLGYASACRSSFPQLQNTVSGWIFTPSGTSLPSHLGWEGQEGQQLRGWTLVPFASLPVCGPIPKAVGREEPSHRSLWLSTLPARAADALRCSKRDDQPEQHLLNAEEQVNSSALTALSATQEGSHLTLLRSYLSKPQVSVAN